MAEQRARASARDASKLAPAAEEEESETTYKVWDKKRVSLVSRLCVSSEASSWSTRNDSCPPALPSSIVHLQASLMEGHFFAALAALRACSALAVQCCPAVVA